MANDSQIESTHRPQSTAPSFAPPRYSVIFQDDGTERAQDNLDGTERVQDNLEVTESPTTSSNYSFSLPTKEEQAWVTLNIQTRPSKTLPKNPRFFADDNVSGTIDLNLTKPQIIHSMNLVLKGRIATKGTDVWPTTFLEEHHIVWEKSNGDPRSLETPTKGFDGKLSGNYQFPFSFPFPDHVDLSSSLGSKGKNSARNSLVCSTPPTIPGDQILCANVDYQLILKITHGLLRSDSKIKTIVTYLPQIIPRQPSHLRQTAYLEGTLLPGPERDPDGWVTLPSIVVCGKIQIAHFPMDVRCTVTLSLATPLSYTRGTVIPCYLTLSSQNSKALELLADHKLQNVRLARTIQFFEDNSKGLDQFSQGKEPKWVKDIREVGLAVWWVPPKDIIQDTYMRQLQGEIHLSSQLPPSSDFLPLSIRYAVQILPFDTDIFEYTPGNLNKGSDVSGTVLQSYPVVIATVNGSGPIPTAFTKRSARPRRKFRDNNNNIFSHPEASTGLRISSGFLVTPGTRF